MGLFQQQEIPISIGTTPHLVGVLRTKSVIFDWDQTYFCLLQLLFPTSSAVVMDCQRCAIMRYIERWRQTPFDFDESEIPNSKSILVSANSTTLDAK